MSKLYKRFSRLVLRFDDIKSVNGVDKHSYHLNYENGRYREGELVSLVRGALPHFALTPEEFRKLKEDDDVDEMYRQNIKSKKG